MYTDLFLRVGSLVNRKCDGLKYVPIAPGAS